MGWFIGWGGSGQLDRDGGRKITYIGAPPGVLPVPDTEHFHDASIHPGQAPPWHAPSGTQQTGQRIDDAPGYGVRIGDEVTLEFHTSAGEEVGVISGMRRVDRNRQVAVRLRDGSTSILDLRPDDASAEVLNILIQSGGWIFVPPRGRSRIRDEIGFWGNEISFVGGVVRLGGLLSG